MAKDNLKEIYAGIKLNEENSNIPTIDKVVKHMVNMLGGNTQKQKKVLEFYINQCSCNTLAEHLLNKYFKENNEKEQVVKEFFNITEALKQPKSEKLYSKQEAFTMWQKEEREKEKNGETIEIKLSIDDIIYPSNPSGRGVNKKIWMNDITGESVFAKEYIK